ncbi:MAG TPA: hypothetical protein VID74_08325 [Gemmatimonadales bacterium]|jgi:hypothetical protein
MKARSILPLITTLALATTSLAAQAPKVPAACQPMIDAQRKSTSVPHHVYSTAGSGRAGDKATTSELISTGNAIYILMNGKWKRSPMTTKEALAQIDENLAGAKVFTCQHVGDEPVAGVAAAVYTGHSENDGINADSRIWIAKGSGLVLRTEGDVDMGGGDKSHMSARYEYTNVQAPAGVK